MGNKTFRFVAALVLFFFSWSNLGIYNLAYAATKDSKQNAVGSQKNEKTTEEKFQESLERLRDAVDKEDTRKLKAERGEIENLDAEIKSQFKETEQKIKDLPEGIKKRHTDFVNKYQENLNTLKTNLNDIDKAKTKEEKKQAHQKTKDFLEKTKPPSKHVPLDPNKLPHRTPDVKKKEPRTKPEEFKQEKAEADRQYAKIPLSPPLIKGEKGGLQSQASSLQSRLLVASNGPLAGLVSELPIFSPSPLVGEGWGEGLSPNYEQQTPNLLVAQATSLPTADDLAETAEIQFTPELQQIATLLENNPVQLYEFVRNNFTFEPYYGSVKGSQSTLLLQSGNDFDQASVLISLYRFSGIPARYVYGTVEIPIEKVMKWLGGITDPRTAGTVLSSNGIPAKLIVTGGTVKSILLEHVWIEAYLSYGNYRGKVNDPNAPKTWIPLDPSFKMLDPNPNAIDMAAMKNFDIDTYFTNYLQEIKPTTPAKDYLKSTMSYIETNLSGQRFYDLLSSGPIIDKALDLLPETLPYPVKAVGARFSSVPDTYRHRITLEFTESLSNETILSYSASWSDLLHKRFTLSYIPAATYDEQTISTYGSLYSTPSYLIQVKPALKVEGVTVAEGSPVNMAGNLIFKMSFYSPQGVLDNVITNNLTIGATHAIGLGSGYTTGRIITYRTAKLEAAVAAGESGDPILGEFLNLLALNYLQELDSSRKMISKTMKLLDTNRMAELMVGVDLGVSYVFGVPKAISINGVFIDADYNISTPIDMAGDQSKVRRF